MPSIFTQIIAGDIPCFKIAEDDNFFAFLDINPVAKGHTLVVPKNEVDYIFDLEDELLKEMILFSKRVAEAIKKTIPCNRIGLSVIGLEVPHAHIHLMPIEHLHDMSFEKSRLNFTKDEYQEIADSIASNFS